MDSIWIASECVEDYQRKNENGWVIKMDLRKPMTEQIGIFWTLLCPERDLVQNGEHGHWESLFLPLLYHNQWIIPPEVIGKEIPFSLFLFTLVADSFSQLLSKG